MRASLRVLLTSFAWYHAASPARADTALLKERVPRHWSQVLDPYAGRDVAEPRVEPLVIRNPYTNGETRPTVRSSASSSTTITLVNPYRDPPEMPPAVASAPLLRLGTLRIIPPRGFRGVVFVNGVQVESDAILRLSPGDFSVKIAPDGQAPFVVWVGVAADGEHQFRFELSDRTEPTAPSDRLPSPGL